MKKTELKQLLRPLIKECIKEVIFEDGTLSGIISEVAKGLQSSTTQQVNANIEPKPQQQSLQQSEAVLEARRTLDETKRSLSESTGLQGIFENTDHLSSGGSSGGQNSTGALRDMDPRDPGVDITGIMKIAGGSWQQLKKG
jgi:hypothetical protein